MGPKLWGSSVTLNRAQVTQPFWAVQLKGWGNKTEYRFIISSLIINYGLQSFEGAFNFAKGGHVENHMHI